MRRIREPETERIQVPLTQTHMPGIEIVAPGTRSYNAPGVSGSPLAITSSNIIKIMQDAAKVLDEQMVIPNNMWVILPDCMVKPNTTKKRSKRGWKKRMAKKKTLLHVPRTKRDPIWLSQTKSFYEIMKQPPPLKIMSQDGSKIGEFRPSAQQKLFASAMRIGEDPWTGVTLKSQ